MDELAGVGVLFTDDRGRRTFYPYGFLGRGYLIDEQLERRIIRVLSVGQAAFLLSVVGALFLGVPAIFLDAAGAIALDSLPPLFLPVACAIFLAHCLWYARATARLTRGLTVCSGRLSFREAMRQNAAQLPWPLLLPFCVFTVWLVATELSALLEAGGELSLSRAVFILYKVLLAGYAAYLAWLKLRDHKGRG